MESYVSHYQKYLRYNKVKEPMIPLQIKNLLKETEEMLDFACGDGDRTTQFINWFLTKDVKVLGYDINPFFRSIWEEKVSRFKHKWIDILPKNYEGEVVHCSHAIYIQEVRDELFDFFNGSRSKVLVIRAIDTSSIFYEITKAWDIDGNFNWEDDLKEYLGKYDVTIIKIPTNVEIDVKMADDYAEWVKTFVSSSGDITLAKNILMKHKDGNKIKFDNSDKIYFITKN